ncbi:hypothetical protein DICVIV_12057 [Dictyocaulus viviparus]|uniref:Calponin-homology (CH) domain-containing protein n=1 Tax=Dictyocaulus viviparus TaxID=29172 RepID=A0A0D8XHZ9_DICVI|nr:hypothetical protein DICVIV_12057 [Dictyocaulus viviparus]
MDSVYEIQQCCSTSNDSRHRILRFGNVRVSDPGYPNAADDHRLSREVCFCVINMFWRSLERCVIRYIFNGNQYKCCYEVICIFFPFLSLKMCFRQLAPNSGLVEISEHAASLRSVEKENQCCETLNKSPSGNSCYKTNKSFMNMSGAVLHSNEEMESVEAPLNEPPSLHISKGSNVVTDNGNEDQHNNIERLTPLDLSNNNSSLIGDAYSVTDVRSVVAGIASVPSKPISKVAPLISVRSKSPLPTVQNSTSKAVQSKICPPSNADSMRRFCRDTSSRGNKNIAHTNAVASKVLTSPPTINNTPLKKSRLSSQSVRPSNIVAGVPKMATRMVDGQHQNVFAKSTISKRDKNAASSPCRILASSKFREVDNAAVDVIRDDFTTVKLISDPKHYHLLYSLPDDIDALVGELADGVHLCNLVNSIRPRFITSIYSSHGAVLTPSKAKRNVDNFVSSCRKLGISEVSICSSSDILNKKNIASVAKTVIALQKFLQKECGSSTSACSSGMDKRRIFHV